MKCVDCGKKIDGSHGRKRCDDCGKSWRKVYAKLHRSQKPPSYTNPKYYRYCKFVETLTDNEICALVSSKKKDLKWEQRYSEKWDELRTCIKILTFYYTLREQERAESRIAGYDEEKERKDALARGVYETEND